MITSFQKWKNIREASEGVCRICGRPREGNAGDWYHEKDCQVKDVLRKMEKETDPKKMALLKRQLKDARYVGD